MRSRDEVLREFFSGDGTVPRAIDRMADRIRELEQERHEDQGVISVWRGRTERAEQRLRELEAQRAASEPVACRCGKCSDLGLVDVDLSGKAHPSAAGVSEPVSNAYTLPDTVQAIIDAAVAYEQWQGKWYDYTVASGEKPAKQQRALIEAVRALNASEVQP